MPVKFADLAKKAKDLFKDDFDTGKVEVTYKLKAADGVAMKFKGDKNNASNAVSFSNETTYTAASGLELKEKINSKDEISIEASKKDVFLKGTKVTGEAKLTTKGGYQGSTFKADYKKGNAVFDAKYSGSINVGSAFEFNQFALGVSAAFKSMTELKSWEGVLAYNTPDLSVTSHLINGTDMMAIVYHNASSSLSTGLELTWKQEKATTGGKIAAAYSYEDGSAVKFKLDQSLGLGLAYTQDLRKGLKLGLAANINAGKLSSDDHSLGCSLTFSN